MQNVVQGFGALASWAVVFSAGAAPNALGLGGDPPLTLFAVHCEPHNANELNWQALASMVAAAEERNIKLTIQFTPPWVPLILGDPAKIAMLGNWRSAGHEIAGHHHTLDHPGSWDGYSNDPAAVNSPRPPGFQGDLIESCLCVDLNGDNDVDLVDFATLQSGWRG